MNTIGFQNLQSTMQDRLSSETLKKAEDLQSKMDPKNSEKAEKAANDFEAMMLKMMLKSMTDSLSGGGFFGEQAGSDFYQDMYLNNISEKINQNQSIGLSKMIMRQLNNDYSDMPINKGFPLQKDSQIEGKDHPLQNQSQVAKTSSVPERVTEPKTLLDRLKVYDPIITKASDTYNVDKKLIQAVIAQESYGNSQAVSKCGAKGLMQLMDGTAKELGVNNPFNAEENIMAGTKYLKGLLNKFEDKGTALAAYNAGPGNVMKYDGIPPFKETIDYVRNVMRYFKSL